MAVQLFSVAGQISQLDSVAEAARLKQLAQAWKYYRGEFPDPLLKTTSDPRGEDNVRLNFAKLIVNLGVWFLFGQDVGFELDPVNDTPEESYLDAVWAANRKMSTLQKLATNGGVTGHALLKIVPQPVPNLPRLIVLDPSNVRVTTDPDDIDTVIRWTVQYTTMIEDARGRSEPLVKRQIIEQLPSKIAWHITDQESRGNDPRFTTVGEMAWPYPFGPIVDAQNLPCPNEYWGISDLEDDVIQPNLAINSVLSKALRTLRHYADPLTWGKGLGGSEIKREVGGILNLGGNGELHNLEMQSDLSSSIEVYRQLKAVLHEVSSVPEVATGKLDNIGQLSGLALKILYGPILEKTEVKRVPYGDLLIETNRRLLALAGHGDQHVTTLHWPELVPSDPLQERQALLLDKQLGVSTETLLTKLGYDPELEARKNAVTTAQLGDALLQSFTSGAESTSGVDGGQH